MSLTAVTAPGTAREPLRSVDVPCPSCGGRTDPSLDQVSGAELLLARATFTAAELEHFLAICEVVCSCGWRGSAFRPDHHPSTQPEEGNDE